MADRKKTTRGKANEKIPFPHGKPMNDRRKSTEAPEESRVPDYSDLKRQAVEDLVTASPENSPPVSRQELKKYHAAPRIKVADWIKAIVLKFWMAGVICYFFVWGLSTFSLNQWDLLLILAAALGMATNLLTNNILRFIARDEGVYDRWMMFPGKSFWFLPLDIVYAAVLVLCTVMTYNGINTIAAGGAAGAAPAVGVEPILFGVLTTAWDFLFLWMKRLGKQIVSDAVQNTKKR